MDYNCFSDCTDNADWCLTMPARDCYVSEPTCCQACSGYYTGDDTCPFGDQVSWCGGYATSESVCKSGDISKTCCDTCKPFLGGIVTTTEAAVTTTESGRLN